MSVISIKLEVDDSGTAKITQFKSAVAGMKPPPPAVAAGFNAVTAAIKQQQKTLNELLGMYRTTVPQNFGVLGSAGAQVSKMLAQNRMDMLALARSGKEVNQSLTAMREAAWGTTTPLKTAAQHTLSFKDRIFEVTGVAQKMARVLVSVQVIMASVVAVLGVRKIIEAADAWATLSARLRLVSATTAESVAAQKLLFALAQDIRTPLADAAELYVRIGVAMKGMGLSQNEMIALTRTVAEAIMLGGASAQEAASSVRQFTQALARGKVDMTELGPLLENAPPLVQALAAGLRQISPEFMKLTESGKSSIGALLEMSKKGTLSSEMFYRALLTQTVAVHEQFKELPMTVGHAFTQVSNEFLRLAGTLSTSGIVVELGNIRKLIEDPITGNPIRESLQGILDAVAVAISVIPRLVREFQALIDILTPIKAGFVITGQAIIKFMELLQAAAGGAGDAFRLFTKGDLSGAKAALGNALDGMKKALTDFNETFATEGEKSEKALMRLFGQETVDRVVVSAKDIKWAFKQLEQEFMKVGKARSSQGAAGVSEGADVEKVLRREAAALRELFEIASKEAELAGIRGKITLEARYKSEESALLGLISGYEALLPRVKKGTELHAEISRKILDANIQAEHLRVTILSLGDAFVPSERFMGKMVERLTQWDKFSKTPGEKVAPVKMFEHLNLALEPLEPTLDGVSEKLLDTEESLGAATKRAGTFGVGLNAVRAPLVALDETLLKIDADLSKSFDPNDFKQSLDLIQKETQAALERADLMQRYNSDWLGAGELRVSAIQKEIAFLEEWRVRLIALGASDKELQPLLDLILKSNDALRTAQRESLTWGNALEKVFGGISDILSIFGVKLGRVLLLLQNLPRAVSGLRGVFEGLGGLLTLGGTTFGAGTAWAETAKSVTALGNASGETAGVLGFMAGTVALITKLLLLFGNGLTWVFGVIAQLIQGLAGGVAGGITSLLSGLAAAGSGLMSVFSGLSSIGSSVYSAFQGVGSLADVFQSAFNALGLTSGGFAPAGQAAGGTLAQMGGAGAFAQMAAEWLPVIGAIYAAVTIIKTFMRGDTLSGIISTLFGSFIGGFFSKTPRAELRARIAPFDRANIGSTIDTSVPGAQVGAAIVDVGGNVMKSSKERALQLALAGVLNTLLQNVVTAMVGMLKVLPPAIATQLDAALADLEASGLEIVDKTWKGGKAGKKFGKRVKHLMEEALGDIVEALDFGDVDLKALGGGDVAKGFEAMIVSLGALSAIAKEAGDAVDFSKVTLAEFTAGAISYFKSFAREGEEYLDTVKRVMESIGGIVQMMDQTRATVAAMTGDVSLAFELMADRLVTLHDRTVSAADALTIAAESGASPEEVLAAAQATQQALEAEIQGVQALKSAVDAMNASIMTGVDLIIELTAKINALRGTELSAADFQTGLDGIVSLFNSITDLSTRIALFSAGLVGAAGNLSLLTAHLPLAAEGFNLILQQIQQLENPVAAIAALKQLAGAVEAGLNAAIAAVNQQTQAQINALNAQKSAISSAADAQRRALQDERDQIAENFDARRDALQEELSLVQQWGQVLDSVRSQLVDLFNLLAPTHPLTSLNEVRAQFDAAFAAFQVNPTVEAAERVQELARQLLQLAQQTPGYDLPSALFQDLASDVRVALEAVEAFAAAQPSQEAIQAQIAALEQEQSSSLTSIDDRLEAINDRESAQLEAIDVQIAAASAAGQAQIAQFQALAAEGLEAIRAQVYIETEKLAAQQAEAAAKLQEILGDKTFEQFIAEKQREAVDVLRGIDATLKAYLGSILTNLFPGAAVPAMAAGGILMGPKLILAGEAGPEAILPLERLAQMLPVIAARMYPVVTGGYTGTGQRADRGGVTNVTFHIHLTASGDVDVKKTVDRLEGELVERVQYGRLRAAIQEATR